MNCSKWNAIFLWVGLSPKEDESEFLPLILSHFYHTFPGILDLVYNLT